MYTRPSVLALVIPLFVGCGDDSNTHNGHVPIDASAPQEASMSQDVPSSQDLSVPQDLPASPEVTTDSAVTDTSANDSAVSSVPVLNDCRAADYISQTAGADTERVVRPRGNVGYTPRCVIVRAGQSVTFEMNFSTHPLVPGVPHGSSVGSTLPNLIARQNSGASYTLNFNSVGYYPFYCNIHGHVGMTGVVRVIP